MARLYLLRHAKSSWAKSGERDFDRGLSERGAGDLPKIAAHMRERDYLPKWVYCSPALRTRLTMHGVILAYDNPPRIEYVDALYSGGMSACLDCIRQHPNDDSIMVIGHNPGMAETAHHLVGTGDPAALEALSAKYPTGALAVINFNTAHWADIGPGTGYLTDFVLPRTL